MNDPRHDALKDYITLLTTVIQKAYYFVTDEDVKALMQGVLDRHDNDTSLRSEPLQPEAGARREVDRVGTKDESKEAG
jgi:hypothetical protein